MAMQPIHPVENLCSDHCCRVRSNGVEVVVVDPGARGEFTAVVGEVVNLLRTENEPCHEFQQDAAKAPHVIGLGDIFPNPILGGLIGRRARHVVGGCLLSRVVLAM